MGDSKLQVRQAWGNQGADTGEADYRRGRSRPVWVSRLVMTHLMIDQLSIELTWLAGLCPEFRNLSEAGYAADAPSYADAIQRPIYTDWSNSTYSVI